MLVLITGGARSGKSAFAERYAAALGSRGHYIATCRIWDEEMEERIGLHRKDREARGFPWETVEEPLELADTLLHLFGRVAPWQVTEPTSGIGAEAVSGAEVETGEKVILVDCLTLWMTNVLLAAETTEQWSRAERIRAAELAEAAVDKLLRTLEQRSGHVLLVTNEVGSGLVPEYPLGRLFRDCAGRMNQRLAAASDQVFLVTAGIPVELKHLAFSLPAADSEPQAGR